MKAKLRALLYGILVVVLELALLYPASLIDQQIDEVDRMHFGRSTEWIAMAARTIVWGSVLIVPLIAYVSGPQLFEYWQRKLRLRNSLASSQKPSTVRVLGGKDWRQFRPEAFIRLVVPDAIASVDATSGLLRLKAIGSHHDSAVSLDHILSMNLQRGETREARGRQSLFRLYNPRFRTLAELPRIRLEIATEGKEPILEYSLFADTADTEALELFFRVLTRAARRARRARIISTAGMLDSLPVQGSKYGFGWI